MRLNTCRSESRAVPFVVIPGLSNARRLSLACSLFCILVALAANAAAATGPRRVLILYSLGRGFSPFGLVASGFRTELAEQFKGPIQFHEATLEASGFTGGESEEPVGAYLRTLFAGSQPDLIVPCGGPAVRFALRQRTRLFPATPLLLVGVEARHLQGFTLDTNTTAVATTFNLPAIIESLRQVRPGTTNIVVVLGHSSLEVFWKGETQREFARFTNRIAFMWCDQLPLGDMLDRVRRLPPQSAVLYLSLFIDAAGVPYEYDGALKALRASANAPIVGLYEEDLGLGILGGPLLSLRDQGREAARVAVRILEGELPGDIHTPLMTPGRPLYDWRELERSGIRVSQLPAGSEVRFREPTFAAQYRRRILGVLGVCLAESALIVALVGQLRRRRKTERSLRESEERMKLAASAAKLGMWEWDLSGDRIWRTDHTEGPIRAAEARSQNFDRFLKLVHPDDRTNVAHAVGRAMNGDGDYESVHRVMDGEGQVRWIAVHGQVEFDGKHKPCRMRGVSLDITARKEAEDRAQESERRFLLLANSAPVLIWASGVDRLCTFFNQSWLEFTGRTMEQEVGNGWAEGVHPEDLPGCMKIYIESFDARRPFTIEYRLRRHDGEYRWISDHGVPRYDEQRAFVGYIGSCIDVTERKEAESELQRTRQELAHVSRVSTLGELAGSLAHELNQPLTAILSNAQAAQRFLNGSPTNLDEVREILKDVVDEDRRAGEIIVRMRAMLKKGEAQMLSQDLNDLIAEVIRLMHSELVVRNVVMATRLTPGLPLVRGDRIQLQQVLLNLIMNACEAVNTNPPTERRVMIETERVGATHVQVSVSDHGPGFAPHVLEKMYEPFCSTKPNGLGMGLAICRSIISAHRGHLWVSQNREHGATVGFTLAVHVEEEP